MYHIPRMNKSSLQSLTSLQLTNEGHYQRMPGRPQTVSDNCCNSWWEPNYQAISDNCFCKLEGQIDDCSCKVDTVDHFNNAKIYPRLASLLAKDYFRYFYYQPFKPCPFWEASSGKCSSSLCQVGWILWRQVSKSNSLCLQVKSCPTTDLPPGISGDVVEAIEKEPEEEESCWEGAGVQISSSSPERRFLVWRYQTFIWSSLWHHLEQSPHRPWESRRKVIREVRWRHSP